MPVPGDYAEHEENQNARTLARNTESGEEDSEETGNTDSTTDFTQESDAHAPASFSKLMAEIGGAWRILVFMAFLATVLAFTYLILLRFFSGPIIWVSISFLHDIKFILFKL